MCIVSNVCGSQKVLQAATFCDKLCIYLCWPVSPHEDRIYVCKIMGL